VRFTFTISEDTAYNPAQLIPLPGALSNPHCNFGGGNGDGPGKKTSKSKSKSNTGKMIVGCIMGSALGAISASVRKASALGNPPRWRSQAEHERIVASGYEKQFELTSREAATALAFCGLGSFALHWERRAPVVRAKY
jgi:hypothetical protein